MAAGSGNTAFFDSTYEETRALLVRARDYAVRTRGQPGTPLSVQVEALRVTARLTQVMAWLMGQRAAAAGEITADQAIQRFSLSAGLRRVCADPGGIDDPAVPRPLRELLAASAALYERIGRLEAMIAARGAGANAAP